MTYQIEKNVPLNTERFPFAQMEAGDSFLVADGTAPGTVHAAARRAGVKIATKKEAQGFRVWLVGKVEA